MAQGLGIWGRTKSGGKIGFGKLYSLVDRLSPTTDKPDNRSGCEAFWPTTLDKECDKAARVLKGFCSDGFDDERPDSPAMTQNPKKKLKHKIPQEVIRNAEGLVIFTTLRTGLWIAGSGGSGVLIGRKADGSWSSPCSIQVQTSALGFSVGVDIYDCVLVINTKRVLETLSRPRTTIGGELALTLGPYGMDGTIDYLPNSADHPLFTYCKTKGVRAAIHLDGTTIIERTDENEHFYEAKVKTHEILSGKERHQTQDIRSLYEMLKSAEGDDSCDPTFLPILPPPSDFDIIDDEHVFGVPAKDDPDPYGVLQLEKEGMVIREAGSRRLASWEQFTFSPAITSPIYDTFEKRSNRDSGSQVVSRRASFMGSINVQVANEVRESRSSRDTPRTSGSMVDMSTQTDDHPPTPTSPGRTSHRSTSAMSKRTSLGHIPENEIATSTSPPPSRTASSTGRRHSHSPPSRSITPPSSGLPSKESTLNDTRSSISSRSDVDEKAGDATEHVGLDDDDLLDDDDDGEEAVIVEAPPVLQPVLQARRPTKVVHKARMIELPKRGPAPLLPIRNPNRKSAASSISAERPSSRSSNISFASAADTGRDSMLPSPDLTPSQTNVNIPEIVTPDETSGEAADQSREPWPGMLALKGMANDSKTSLEVPGAFHSAPATPDEEQSLNPAV